MKSRPFLVTLAVIATGLSAWSSPSTGTLEERQVVLDSAGHGKEVPERWDRGMNFVGFDRNAFSAGAHNGSVIAARDQLGTKTAVLVPHWHVKNRNGSHVRRTRKTPSESGLLALARRSKRAGMDVVIKPHVDSLDETWRGELNFPNRAAFWEDYTRIMSRCAVIAHRARADGLVIGTELSRIQDDQPAMWRRLIRKVRHRFGGTIYYAANYDTLDVARTLPGWFSLLDVIGVDYYLDNSDISPEVLTARIAKVRQRFGLRVVLSEGGGNNQGDQIWYYRGLSSHMLRLLGDRAWFEGIWWYNRFTFVKGGYGKTWDYFTPTMATSKWLCRQQTKLSDEHCDQRIERNW